MKTDEEYIRKKWTMPWLLFPFFFLQKKETLLFIHHKIFQAFFPPTQLYVSLGVGHAESLGMVWRVNLWVNKIMWLSIQSCISHRVHYSLKIDLHRTTYHLQHVAGSWFHSSPEGIMSVNNQLLLTCFASWQSIETFRFLNWKNMLYFFFTWM